MMNEDWRYTSINNQMVEYAVDPDRHELQRFLRENAPLRAINYQGRWYFWDAANAIHDQFTTKVFGFRITDYFKSFDRRMYQLIIEDQGYIDDTLFTMLVKYFDHKEFTWEEILDYMKHVIVTVNNLRRKYNFSLTNRAKQSLKEIMSGEAFE